MKATINGISLEYDDKGEGLPVILIHAFPLNRRMWDEQVSFLSTSCRVISLDLRGFGGSEAPDGPYYMKQMAADVRGLMSHVSMDCAIIVGLSMGGYVALALYRDYPESVCGMVLADTRATADTEEARERRLKTAAKVEREGARVVIDDMIDVLLSKRTLESQPDVVERVRSIMNQASAASIAAAQRGMADRVDSSDLLPRLACPVLVIVGSEDSPTPPKDAELMHNAIPGSALRVINEVGHLSNLEDPAAFNDAVIGFVSLIKSKGLC